MLRHPRSASRKTRLRVISFTPATLIIVVVVAIVALAVSTRERLAKSANVASQSQVTAAVTPAPARLDMVLITVRPHGFDPKEIKRSAGRFLLAVNNRSGLSEVALRLDHVVGVSSDKLHEVNVPHEKLDWRNVFDLPPGNYVLSETNHPGWNCSLTISAK